VDLMFGKVGEEDVVCACEERLKTKVWRRKS
jgi:hypothetical protein